MGWFPAIQQVCRWHRQAHGLGPEVESGVLAEKLGGLDGGGEAVSSDYVI